MTTVTLPHPRLHEGEARTPSIDPRSFHAFEFDGENFLFDRASAALLKIDEVSFSAFQALEAGSSWDGVLDSLEAKGADVQETFSAAVTSMHRQGMFRYKPVDHSEQRRLMERLWRHHPRRVQLLMAQGCNLGCRYCYAWRNGSNQKSTLMPWEIAKASVDHLVRNSGGRTDLQVTFFGGEPLLNLPVIKQIVAYCRKLEQSGPKRFLFELITNGTLLTPEVTDWIVAEKFILFISLDGWKEMHNYNRPSMSGEDLHQTIVDHAIYANKEFEAHGLVPVKVRANLTNRFHDSYKVGNYLASLGFRVIGVGAIEPLPHGNPSPSAMTEAQMEELFSEATQNLKHTMQRLIKGEKIERFEYIQLQKAIGQFRPVSLKGITCGVARNTQVVDNKGNIFPCHRYEGMEAYIIGNVFEGLDREKTMAYYAKLNGNATNRCHSCWIRDYCGGGCAWLLSTKEGHLADPTLQECDRRRRAITRSLWLRQKMRQHFPERFSSEERNLDSLNLEFLNESGLSELTESGDPKTEASCGSCENCGPSGCTN